jgi:cobalt-zinc-cadmium resistance protein CzcA
MISKLVNFAIDQRIATAIAVLLLIVFGVYAYRHVPVEAFPDPDDVHVQVITLWPGQAAEDVETQVTRPAEQQLNGTPGLSGLRSVSMFGLSVITLTFEDGIEDNFARAQTLEKMQAVSLPAAAQWQLAALSTSTGEVFRYVLRSSPGTALEELRAVQDWVVEPKLRQVPGVADVVAFGGGVKQYQVSVLPERLVQHGVTISQLLTALQSNNLNVGGGTLRTGEQSLVVRGVGALSGVDDIGSVAVASQSGRPVYVRDVASVSVAMSPRQGIVSFYRAPGAGRPAVEADDVIEGIVLSRKGSNALEIIDALRSKVSQINAGALPPGVRIEAIYDRSELVNQTVSTVLHNLAEGAILVLVILLLFTSSLWGAAIVASVIPLSLLSAFIVLHVKGVPANLLSFGAVDFGIIVDAAVVVVEAVLVKRALDARAANFSELTRDTTSHLGHSIVFAKAIILASLIPIFTFERVEGRIFRPMALTITAAIVGASILSLTLVPLASSILLGRGRIVRENLLVRTIVRVYRAMLRWTLDHKAIPIALTALMLTWAILLGRSLGTEFLPKLDEGNIWLTVTQPLSTSIEQAKQTEQRIREIVRSFPEVRLIYGQVGRPDDGTDPKGANVLEMAAYLRPTAEWTTKDESGNVVDKEGLIRLMNQKLAQIPGLELNFSQVIEDNVEEALSGVKGELAIKVFGDDLTVLQQLGERVRQVVARVPGVADLAVERIAGQPNLTIALKRDAIARAGLDAQTVLTVVDAGLGGRAVGAIIEGQRRFDLVVRLDEHVRESAEQIGRLWIDTPSGQRLPLSQLADIGLGEGASRIARDANSRRIALKCGVRGRDMGGFVTEAQRRVAAEVKLPTSYSILWEGQFENQQRATQRLAIIVPLSLLLVLALLFWAFQRVRYALLIMLNVPLALIGGIALLRFTHTNLSVSAMIGFIALSGASVQNGLILVGQFNTLRVKGSSLRDAVLHGACARVRPVLMTALMASLGMYPAAVSHGIGSEVQRPLALVILGGMLSAALLTLLVLPVLYEWIERVFPATPSAPEGLID